MKIVNNHPLIEAGDYPLTIVNAFLEPNWYDSLYEGDKYHYRHGSHKVWETIEDKFVINRFDGTINKPDSDALILEFGIDHLEFALVNYGCRLITDGTTDNKPEIARIDQILRNIDIAKGIGSAISR